MTLHSQPDEHFPSSQTAHVTQRWPPRPHSLVLVRASGTHAPAELMHPSQPPSATGVAPAHDSIIATAALRNRESTVKENRSR